MGFYIWFDTLISGFYIWMMVFIYGSGVYSRNSAAVFTCAAAFVVSADELLVFCFGGLGCCIGIRWGSFVLGFFWN